MYFLSRGVYCIKLDLYSPARGAGGMIAHPFGGFQEKRLKGTKRTKGKTKEKKNSCIGGVGAGQKRELEKFSLERILLEHYTPLYT